MDGTWNEPTLTHTGFEISLNVIICFVIAMRAPSYHEPLMGGHRRNRPYNQIREIEMSSKTTTTTTTTRQGYQPPNATAAAAGEEHSGDRAVIPGRADHHHHQNSRPSSSFRNASSNPRATQSSGAVPSFVPRQQHYYASPMLRRDNPAKNLKRSLFSHGLCCLQCVRTQEVGIVEQFGAFYEIIGPGIYCGGVWPCTIIKARLTLRVQQLDMKVETKTSDNVFLYIHITVQYRVLVERAYDAYYRLADTTLQIRTHVYDVIRSTIPRMDLDQVFASKTEIADTVFTKLQRVMKEYGYEIVSTLVARITPNEVVKDSMNEINASKRMKEAVPYKAEAEKISKVKAAEAHALQLYLEGVGIAKQRGAMIEGLQSCVVDSSKDPNMASTREVMDLLLVSQYLDTLVAVGAQEMIVRPAPSEMIDIQKNLPTKADPSMLPRALLRE